MGVSGKTGGSSSGVSGPAIYTCELACRGASLASLPFVHVRTPMAASFLYRFCRPPCAASPRNLQTTFDRETSIRAGGASRSAGLRTDHGHNELEHSENVHAGLYARLASSSSMAETRRGSSAVTSGANRATTSPLRLSRNFSKFHSTSAEFSEFTP
jgi:hypothetical protein